MARRKAIRRDSMNRLIESALLPGSYISYYDGSAFVSGLRRVEEEIEALIASDPSRAVTLYENFLAGCTAKADEADDSDGEFGTFAGGLFPGWIRARQAAGADSDETVRILLKFMEDDSYGFCNDLESTAVKVFDRAGLQSFERAARSCFDEAFAALDERKSRHEVKPGYYVNHWGVKHWGEMLKAIYLNQRDVGKYIELTVQAGLTRTDCGAIAAMFRAKRKPKDALAWVERGLGIEKGNYYGARASYELDEMRRALLVKLGRGGEALDSAWAEFRAHPDKDIYEELLRYVPRAERGAWHEKAMDVSGHCNLSPVIELWLAAKETNRLAARLERTGDKDLERLSHYVTEPAAERLAKSHPGVAAKLFRAVCMRVVDAGKSKYYAEALSSLEKAKNCYRRAGLDAQWQELLEEIRREPPEIGFYARRREDRAGRRTAQETVVSGMGARPPVNAIAARFP